MKLFVTNHAADRMRTFGLSLVDVKRHLRSAVDWEPSHHSKYDPTSVTVKDGPYLFVLNAHRTVLITVFDQRINLKGDEL